MNQQQIEQAELHEYAQHMEALEAMATVQPMTLQERLLQLTQTISFSPIISHSGVRFRLSIDGHGQSKTVAPKDLVLHITKLIAPYQTGAAKLQAELFVGADS